MKKLLNGVNAGQLFFLRMELILVERLAEAWLQQAVRLTWCSLDRESD